MRDGGGATKLHFERSDNVLARAEAVRLDHRDRLADIAGDADLRLTGGSSTPGLLTSGDIDLHLRVPPDRFEAVVGELHGRYAVVHPEIWSSSLATFAAADDPLVGLAVTPIGSEHDRRFALAWDRLRTDADARDAYNEMKREHLGGDLSDYLREKARFFDLLASEQ